MNSQYFHGHFPRAAQPARAAKRVCWLAGCLGCLVLGLAGCSGFRWDRAEPAAHNRTLRPDYHAFAAKAIRVHPLTHLALVGGEAVVVCHIEVLDRWGDSVKALGTLQVQLYQAQGGAGATSAVQILKWDVPLTDEKYNAGAYDPATQTYRFSLGGLPAWLADVVRKNQAEKMSQADALEQNQAGGSGVRPRIRFEIRAVFQTLGPAGEEQVLRDGMELAI